jgi:hypothetical protein
MPEVGPPGDLTVDGVPAQQQRVLTSALPVLAWSEPSLGLSRAYQVRVVELYRSSLDGTTRGRDVYKIYTSARSVRIPPNVLHSGKSYVLVVGSMANVSGPFNVDTAPFYSHGSLDLAESATSMLTVP